MSGVSLADCAVNIDMHSKVVRTGTEWFRLQPTNGPIDYSHQDSVFNCYIQNGMQVFYTLAFAPNWAGGSGDCGGDGNFNCGMPDLNAWYGFVYDVINHYTQIGLADRMIFGIWNEPDGRFLTNCPFGGGQGDKVSCWGQLWQQASLARSAANPSARLAGPEMGRIDSIFNQALTLMSPDIRPQDIISIHWYPESSSWIDYWVNSAKSQAGGRETWVTESGVNNCNDTAQLLTIDQVMAAYAQYAQAGAYIYYQVVAGDADGCFDVHLRPSFDDLRKWADFLTPPGAPVTLGPGDALSPGQSVTSPNGTYTLIFQSDGNLELYRTGGEGIWSSGTAGYGAIEAQMRSYDGNFVIYDMLYNVVWSTDTAGNPGAYLSVQDDGALCVYSPDGRGIAVIHWEH